MSNITKFLHESPEPFLEALFNTCLERGYVEMCEKYLEEVKVDFSQYDAFMSKIYVAKAEELTQSINEGAE